MSNDDIVQRLRNFAVWNNRQSHYEPVPLCQEAANEIERLLTSIRRIDAINDSPARFSQEINEVCDGILRPHLTTAVPEAIEDAERRGKWKTEIQNDQVTISLDHYIALVRDHQKLTELESTSTLSSHDRGTE